MKNIDINLGKNVFTASIECIEFFIKSDVMPIPIDGTCAITLIGTALPFSALTYTGWKWREGSDIFQGFGDTNVLRKMLYWSQINIPGVAVNLDSLSWLICNTIMGTGTVILTDTSTLPIRNKTRGTHASRHTSCAYLYGRKNGQSQEAHFW